MIHLYDTLGEIMAPGKQVAKTSTYITRVRISLPFFMTIIFCCSQLKQREVKPHTQKHNRTPSPEDQVKNEH